MLRNFSYILLRFALLILSIFPISGWCQLVSPDSSGINANIVNDFIKHPDPIKVQKVGLVLSGGGAKGMAHIGVIRALEEHNIPIDYIAGTSMGSVIAGMYAIGMNPDEMEAFAKSPEFGEVVRGVINEDYLIYFIKEEPNASWLSLKIAKDTIWETSLPTNLINPIGLDFMMMEHTAGPSAAANYNFDSLFIPFRCVAADIESKQEVIFKNGQLNEAIRASATFPFYLKPIRVKNKLLFDGGLYNNFPADIMYNDFFPDIILGSNVSGNVSPPTEDNVLSHIKNMMVSKTNFSVICDNGILIEPQHKGGTFSFNLIESFIDSGYSAAIRKMPEIKNSITIRVSNGELQKKREGFKSKQTPIIIDQVHVTGLKKTQANYVKKILGRTKISDNPLSIATIKPLYYRLFQDARVGTIFPTAKFNNSTGFYDLHLYIKKAKNISLDLGGILSNRPITGGFIGIQYHYQGNLSINARANAYVGKLYKSAQLKTRIDFPIKRQFYVEPHITYNQWDYFKSSTDFFDNKTPSYLLQKENYAGIDVGFPVTNKGKIQFGVNYMVLKDEYYQIKNFTKLDTADQTNFNGVSVNFVFEKSTLNKKQYANKGQQLKISSSYNAGKEIDSPGSTSYINEQQEFDHNWFQIKLVSDGYYNNSGPVRLGYYFELVYSTQDLFNNYTSSIMRAPAFNQITETKTIFIEALRAHKYATLGQKLLIKIRKKVDLRLEGYMFQPYRSITNTENEAKLGKGFSTLYTLGAGSLVYYSPLGPMCLSINYYHNIPGITEANTIPITFLFHFGYVIFNRKAI